MSSSVTVYKAMIFDGASQEHKIDVTCTIFRYVTSSFCNLAIIRLYIVLNWYSILYAYFSVIEYQALF